MVYNETATKEKGELSMRLYFIRHGQTEANFTRSHSGWNDVTLTETGREQARRVGDIIKAIGPDKVYCSDLRRTRDTREIAYPEMEAELCPIIREISVGHLAGRAVADCIAEYGDDYVHNRKIADYRPYGGENREDLLSRCRSFLELVEKTNYERIVAFSHGGFILQTLDTVTGVNNDKSIFGCDNCGVFVFENTGSGWRMVTWNYTGEL